MRFTRSSKSLTSAFGGILGGIVIAVTVAALFLPGIIITTLTPNARILADDTNPARIGPNTTLKFVEKKATLTSESIDRLNALIESAKAEGRINEVQVAAWSDNPVPRN